MDGNGRLVKGARWLEDRASSVLDFLALLFLALGVRSLRFNLPLKVGLNTSTGNFVWPFIVVGIALSLFIFGQSLARDVRDKIRDLRQDLEASHGQISQLEDSVTNKQEDLEELFALQLRTLSDEILGIGDSERVSVYVHTGESFRMVSRYSKDPFLERAHRGQYPENQGVIGDAWSNGYAEDSHMPESEDDWIEYQKSEWDIPADVASDMPMKCRSINAFAVPDSRGDRVGVVVLESTEPNLMDRDTLMEVRDGPHGRMLSLGLETMKPHIGEQADAQAEGL